MAVYLRPSTRALVYSLGQASCRSRPACVSTLPRQRLGLRHASTALKYTKEHEWVSFDETSGIGTMGITDYAQQSLGDIAYVELPAAGQEVEQGDQIGAVESVKAASDIYAPISGVIEEVNESLDEKPALVNTSPEDEGWLCRIKVKDAKELGALLDDAAYKAHCEGEDEQKH